jgi:hypothetical protein
VCRRPIIGGKVTPICCARNVIYSDKPFIGVPFMTNLGSRETGPMPTDTKIVGLKSKRLQWLGHTTTF